MTTTFTNLTATDIVGQVITVRGTEYYVRTAYYAGPGLAATTLFRLRDWADVSGKISLRNTETRLATAAEVRKAHDLVDQLLSLVQGSLVTLKDPRTPAQHGLWVIATVNEKSMTIFPLGGGRGLRVGPTGLNLVDPKDVLK